MINEETRDPRARITDVRNEVGKVIVGQNGVISGMITALLIGGHVLLEGVPGTAKTLMVNTLASALSLNSTRVQFTAISVTSATPTPDQTA